MSGQIYVISGPSGAGKSTIIKETRENIQGIGYSVSHTSRSPRKNETDGVDYHFVEKGAFEKMIQEDAFVEWANVYTDLYGTSFSSLRSQTEKGMDVFSLKSENADKLKKGTLA